MVMVQTAFNGPAAQIAVVQTDRPLFSGRP